NFCPSPTPPLHGSEEDATNLYVLYDIAFFSCDYGYSLFGSQEVMCSGTGEWTPAVPTCEEHCHVPALFNGNASFAPGTLVLSGDVLIVSCDQGFTLNGPNSVTCRDGTWQAAIGQCLENCISPLIPNSNYEALGHEVVHGEYVVVTCDNGYTSGSGSNYSTPMTCSDGVWDISVDCYANCPAPTFPPSLRITPAARTADGHYYHNDDITVTCAPNYRHVHGPTSATLTCNDGYWTPDYLPVCI
ncbi:protein lev-9-like, partial [Diadema antillarum]|uniref:protein lev-9-like n=1 Tax=Diadema antillarum TaxID=105358 RepID=UPI003A8C5AB8